MPDSRPNILFIMSDDHAAHAISAYGSVINETPNIDRLGSEGARFDNVFCTNSICAPSRATILSGTHSHVNGVLTLADRFDGSQVTFPKLLQEAGYQTAIFGKWHLGHGGEADPTGFDAWSVLPGQGDYHDPAFYVQGEERHVRRLCHRPHHRLLARLARAARPGPAVHADDPPQGAAPSVGAGRQARPHV